MNRPRGSVLLLLLISAFLLYRSRLALPTEGPPAFFIERTGKIPVHLGPGFRVQGVHQISDGTPLGAVIAMTDAPDQVKVGPEDLPFIPLRPGETLSISSHGTKSSDLTRTWMPAGQRVALAISLHPDRMTLLDWEHLPRLGPRLAKAIESDRQQNGDFETLEALDRVKGIGPKRILIWKEYFSED